VIVLQIRVKERFTSSALQLSSKESTSFNSGELGRVTGATWIIVAPGIWLVS